MEEFFARLKEHKLVQWTLGYVAVSFALIPVLDIIASRFGWPQTAVRCIIIALATGFFMMLVVAWYHGERGVQRVSRTEHMILAVLLLLGALAMWRIAPTTATGNTAESSATSAAPVNQKSIAVLPLVNDSGDPNEQYFSDGLSENLITALSQFVGLKVIGRNSAFQFRDSKDDSKTIGEKLGVAHLLEGSVQRAGDVVRVSAELVNADDGSTLWSERYDRPYRDLFALQDDITNAVANALKARLQVGDGTVAQSERPPSGSLDAYTAYLQGQFYAIRDTEVDNRKAIDFYTTATHLDPRYAQAYAALSYAWTGLAGDYLGGAELQQAYVKARAASDIALALDPNLTAAHVARGYLLLDADFDWPAAQAEFRRALQLTPNDGPAKFNLGQLLAALGQPAQAVELTRQVLATDPQHASWYNWLAVYLLPLGRLDEAGQAIRKAIALQPGAAYFHVQLVIIAILRGDAKAALAAAQQEPPGNWQDTAMALAQQISGDRAAADAALKTLIDKDADNSAYQIAEVYALRKDPPQTFAWLDRAWANRDPGISNLLIDPLILRYKDDPRFAAFCRKVGLPVPGATPSANGVRHD